MEDNRMTINGNEYEVVRLLGKGKGGYSYLVTGQTQPLCFEADSP